MKNFQYLYAILSYFLYLAVGICEESCDTDTNEVAKIKYDTYRARAFATQVAALKNRTTGCTLKNVIVRKEWYVPWSPSCPPNPSIYPIEFLFNPSKRSTLSLSERQSYINAVLCLQLKPSKIPNDHAPGARSHFDDFVATHINQTVLIHSSVSILSILSRFLSWHRYFVHVYEAALRNECGYPGAQPYWDWSAHDATPNTNALFSDSGSIGGNGKAIVHNDTKFLIPTVPPAPVVIPAGTGGGCITTGPFVNYTVNLGPGPAPGGLEYNPRCLVRDFRPWMTNVSNTYSNVTETISLPNVTVFQETMEFTGVTVGIHPGGHGGVGGTMVDLYSSPADPAFFFHHAQIDHVWLLWQAQDFPNRTVQIGETLTFSNSPPSAPGTPNTTTDLGFLEGTYLLKELGSTIDGPFCYIYE
ncbi:hypothetical protein HYFRA_00010116 [Hymenoscyphus fraxineus]|uniref:Tyrosinase copper-binding domain-containing protein n=1 Tax=Hymenoscyphus fraxineus TaxID=746836 RepID=A0A9N9KUK9_9HELO|nr:hypothetical protein HYFRA_00010116 [Hymenoscyphus fraxineus]